MRRRAESSISTNPLIPAKAGIQEPQSPARAALGPGIRRDERMKAEPFEGAASNPDRRRLVLGGVCLTTPLLSAPALAEQRSHAFRAIEARTGGRLGLWAGVAGRGPAVAWRADERFLMCSTFKALAVSAVLAQVDHGQARLDRWIAYGKADLLDYAPVTTDHLAKGGMTLGDLCAAAVELSDNTAANLILASLGGPAGVTGFIRRLGDSVTRLDRTEPTLNRPAPGGLDTTTPASMTGLWRRLVLGDALSPSARAQLNAWLAACQTGVGRLPSILPKGWRIGHKTGTGSTTVGDVAVLTPPTGAPILIAVYLDGAKGSDDQKDAAIAEAGRAALALLAPAFLAPV